MLATAAAPGRWRIDAALGPAEIALLPRRDLGRVTAVVFDVLRATSSMLAALAAGATEIWPVATVAEALALKERMPDALLGGERGGDRIDGFDLGNSPAEYGGLAGRRVICTTTNGTVACRQCAGAARVLVGAMVNLRAVAAAVAASRPPELLLVCAGTHDTPALEDAIAAGALCAALPPAELTDAAWLVRAAYERFAADCGEGLRLARNGRALAVAGRGGDIAWCARASAIDVVGEMGGDGCIRRLAVGGVR